MLLYRFRSDQNPEFTLDILRTYRLFCADWRELNDPMEGTYSTLLVDDPSRRADAKRAIFHVKDQLRVCSLTKTYKKHTMWAYYANAFRGVAIEIELHHPALHPVDYASGARIQSWAAGKDAHAIAHQILTKKHIDWRGEEEVRLLVPGHYFQLPGGGIKSVILGSRIEPAFENAIRGAAGGVPLRRLMIRAGELQGVPA